MATSSEVTAKKAQQAGMGPLRLEKPHEHESIGFLLEVNQAKTWVTVTGALCVRGQSSKAQGGIGLYRIFYRGHSKDMAINGLRIRIAPGQDHKASCASESSAARGLW